MVSHTDGPRDDDRLPPEDSWRVGRPWVGVVFVVLATINIALTVPGLLAGDDAAAGNPRTWLPLVAAAAFVVLAVGEFRRRAEVDAEGVHLVETFRRRTYPWRDVAEVRHGRPTFLGDAFVYVLRNAERQVELPNSAGRLRLIQRWHSAVSRR